jgi:guanylate kinase
MNASAHKPLVLIISAPSGSGKSTLVNELFKRVRDLDFSVSYTTRAPRGAEQNGKQYYFVTRDQFERMMQEDEFLEYAQVFGYYYGTARRFLREAEKKGRDLLLDIDVQGAQQIKQKLPDAVSIFVLPPDRKILEQRLRKRGEDAHEVIERRLHTAKREIENYNKYDYILVNDRLKKSVQSLEAIVGSERLQRAGRPLSKEQAAIVKLADQSRLANARDRVKPILDSFHSNDENGS